MAEDFKIASLFLEVLGVPVTDGHLAALAAEPWGALATDGHLAALPMEVWGVPSTTLTIDAGAATATWAALGATARPGGAQLDAGAATATWAALGATATPGGAQFDAGAATATWAALAGRLRLRTNFVPRPRFQIGTFRVALHVATTSAGGVSVDEFGGVISTRLTVNGAPFPLRAGDVVTFRFCAPSGARFDRTATITSPANGAAAWIIETAFFTVAGAWQLQPIVTRADEQRLHGTISTFNVSPHLSAP